MAWIKTINYEDADSQLKRIYKKVKGPQNNVDNVLMIHSLRSHSLTGHMALYKNVLHNSNNTLPKWYLESLGVLVSYLNQCDYCVTHHFSGFKRLLNDDHQADLFLNSVKNDQLEKYFDEKYLAGAHYARKLTLSLNDVSKNDIINLQTLGFSDGEILEINQVSSYFNYVNRTVLGLGVNVDGDIIGLSPNESDDPDNWAHQ